MPKRKRKASIAGKNKRQAHGSKQPRASGKPKMTVSMRVGGRKARPSTRASGSPSGSSGEDTDSDADASDDGSDDAGSVCGGASDSGDQSIEQSSGGEGEDSDGVTDASCELSAVSDGSSGDDTRGRTVPGQAFAASFRKIMSAQLKNEHAPVLGKVKRRHKVDLQAQAEREERKRLAEAQALRRAMQRRGRVHDPPVYNNAERRRVKTATKGVVQLFNAVTKHQRKLEAELGKHTVPKASIDDMSRTSFLDLLARKGGDEEGGATTADASAPAPAPAPPATVDASRLVAQPAALVASKQSKQQKAQPKGWGVLQDNMLTNNAQSLKDWDQQESDDDDF